MEIDNIGAFGIGSKGSSLKSESLDSENAENFEIKAKDVRNAIDPRAKIEKLSSALNKLSHRTHLSGAVSLSSLV